MSKRKSEPFDIRLGANSDPENLAKLSKIYNNFKAKLILKEIEKYPEDVQKEILAHFDDTA